MVFIPTENKGFSIPMPMGILGLEEAMKKGQPQKQQKDKGSK